MNEMEASCSFKFIVGSACSYDRQDRSKLFEVIPFVSCNKDVQGYKSAWCFARVENESELNLARGGIFYMSAKDINAVTICPFHRSELGEGARIPTEFQMTVGMSAQISLEIERAVQEVGGTIDTKEDLAFVTLQSKQCTNMDDQIDKSTKTALMKVAMIQVKNRAIPRLKYFFLLGRGLH